MKIIVLLLIFSILSINVFAGKLKVIATFPDLKWAAEQIGGKEIKAEALGKGNQDPHHVDAKPSFMLKLNKADVFIQNGMEQEIGWVPPLLEGARNAKILKGAPGFIDVSVGIRPKEVPVRMDRSLGDVHPSGNPHFLMDPACVLTVLDNIYRGLVNIKPEKQELFKKNLEDAKRNLLIKIIGESIVTAMGTEKAQAFLLSGEFDKKLKENALPAELGGWMLMAKSLRGVKVLYYHQSWKYFADRFGIKIAGYIEPKPGIPPSPAHLLSLKNKIINEKIPLIVTSTYHHPRAGKKLSKITQAKALWLPNLVGGVKNVKTYPELVEYNLNQMLEALPK